MHQASHSSNMQPPCPASRRLSEYFLCLPSRVCALLKGQPESVQWPSLGPEPTLQPMLERRKCCWWSKNKQTREKCSQRPLKDLKETRGKSDRPVAVWVRDPKHPNSWFSIAFHIWTLRIHWEGWKQCWTCKRRGLDSCSHSDFITHLLCKLGQAISLVSVASSTKWWL